MTSTRLNPEYQPKGNYAQSTVVIETTLSFNSNGVARYEVPSVYGYVCAVVAQNNYSQSGVTFVSQTYNATTRVGEVTCKYASNGNAYTSTQPTKLILLR